MSKRENVIPSLLKSTNAKVGLELGVYKGEFSKILLENWDGRLYMISFLYGKVGQ